MSSYDYETIFTFRKSKYFWKFINRQMMLQDLEELGDDAYQLLLFSKMPENFNDAIDVNTGCLVDSSEWNTLPRGKLEIIDDGFTNVTFPLRIDWIDDGENGFTLKLDSENDIDILIDDDVSFDLRGVALVRTQGAETGDDNYVVAFARLSTPQRCQNAITLLKYTEFVGHTNCKER